MMTYSKITTEAIYDHQALLITLNAPKGNILDGTMMKEIQDAARKGARDPQIKALIFQGAGDHFSFGASVPEHQKRQVKEMLATFRQLFVTLIEIQKPTFALVRGQCLGGAMELASFCHWIFASEKASFGQPEIVLGVFPPAAALILPYKMGQAAADDLILTGRSIPAFEAREMGLVYSVSNDPADELRNFFYKHIAPMSAASLAFAAQASRFEMHRALTQHLDTLEQLYVNELMETADANEGITAFLEKRPPVWKHG